MLLVHGFYLCLKDRSLIDIIVCCFTHVAQIPARFFVMLKIRTLCAVTGCHNNTYVHGCDIFYILIYIQFFIFELQCTVCWAEEFIVGTNACFARI